MMESVELNHLNSKKTKGYKMRRRISDLAIEVGIDSTVILEELKQMGIDVSSQMAHLDEYLVELILLHLEKVAEEKSKSWIIQKRCPVCDREFNGPLPPFCEQCGWIFTNDNNLQNNSGKLLVATKRIWNAYLKTLKKAEELEDELNKIKAAKPTLKDICYGTPREFALQALRDDPNISMTFKGLKSTAKTILIKKKLTKTDATVRAEYMQKIVTILSDVVERKKVESYQVRQDKSCYILKKYRSAN